MRIRNFLRVSACAGCIGGFVSSSYAATVSGRVLEVNSLRPITDAIVIRQATGLQTTTALDGTYILEVGSGSGLVLVGAKKAYFNNSVLANAGAMGVDILLSPVPQDDDPTYAFVPPADCGSCHPNQLQEWNGTPMAKAGFNTWVHDTYSGTGTPGGMGGFVYRRDSAFAANNPASECASCHQPEYWLNNLFGPLADPQLPPTPAVSHGVACDICHKIADVAVSKINYPGVFPGAVTVTRPAGPSYHQVQYGILPDTNYSQASLMRASYQPQIEAEVCAACHQDKNDLYENHTFEGVISEPTYLEWLATPYSDPQSPRFATCADCHMAVTNNTILCNVLVPPLERPLGSIRSHQILGTTPEYLDNAVELDLQTQQADDELAVQVTITNSLTGHHVPTGVTIRNMILLVEAWREGDDPLESPLPQTAGDVIHPLGGVGDPAQGYYGGLPGRFYAKVNHDAQGQGPTFFTDATGIQFDNRIPALESDQSAYRFSLPLSGGSFRVRARLIYRRSFRATVDAKQWTTDGHGNPLEDIAPPHFGHLMEMAEEKVVVGPLGGACCLPGIDCALFSETGCAEIVGGVWLGAGTDCSDGDGDGIADACAHPQAIPTVSEWGLLILGLVLAIGSKIMFGGRCGSAHHGPIS